MTNVVVADASPLIVLARIEHLHLLPRVFEQVIVPDAVRHECLADLRRAGARAIDAAFESGRLCGQPGDVCWEPVTLVSLNAGESAAIGLALALCCPVLMDESLGRAVARRRLVPVVGTLGVLLKSKQLGIVPKVAPLLHRMKEEGYFLAERLEREALRLAQEPEE